MTRTPAFGQNVLGNNLPTCLSYSHVLMPLMQVLTAVHGGHN